MSGYVEPRVDRGELSFETTVEALGFPADRIGLVSDPGETLDLWSTPTAVVRSILVRRVRADDQH